MSTPDSTSDFPSTRVHRWSARWAVVSIIAGFGVLLLIEVQHRGGAQRFAWLPGLVLFALMALGVAGSLVIGMWRLFRGPQRGRAMLWLFIALLPAAFWGTVFGYGLMQWSQRMVPRQLPDYVYDSLEINVQQYSDCWPSDTCPVAQYDNGHVTLLMKEDGRVFAEKCDVIIEIGNSGEAAIDWICTEYLRLPDVARMKS